MGIWTSSSNRCGWRAGRNRMVSELGSTRRELLTGATALLRGAGLGDGARREAVRIWAGLEVAPSASHLLDEGAVIAPERSAVFLAAIRRRAAGEPLAHVPGWAGFRHLMLRSDARALIPRPETEGLVDLVLSRIRTGRVADVGTGTGCLALSLATEGAFGAVLAVDRSAAALALARENA